MTNIFSCAIEVALALEEKLSPFVVATAANPMRWFGVCCIALQRVSKNSRFKSIELVALFLSFPCFYISDFFFKFCYTLNQRRLFRLGSKCAALGGHNYGLQLNNFSLNFRDRFKLQHCLCNVLRGAEVGNQTSDKREIGHKRSNAELCGGPSGPSERAPGYAPAKQEE